MDPAIPEAQQCWGGRTAVPANDGGNTVVTTRLPSAGFSITIRIAVTADASSIGRLTTCVGEAGAIHDHRVVEHRTFAVLSRLERGDPLRELLDVIAINLRHLVHLLDDVPVVRQRMVAVGDADLAVGA